MLVGITNQWTEVDWTRLTKVSEISYTLQKQVGWGCCNFKPRKITLVADKLVLTTLGTYLIIMGQGQANSKLLVSCFGIPIHI